MLTRRNLSFFTPLLGAAGTLTDCVVMVWKEGMEVVRLGEPLDGGAGAGVLEAIIASRLLR